MIPGFRAKWNELDETAEPVTGRREPNMIKGHRSNTKGGTELEEIVPTADKPNY